MEQSTQTYNDPIIATQAKNLTKAIFQHESGTNYNATGDAGTSKGAGQWQPNTWKAQAKDVLGNENAPMTPENQSIVAQGTIRKLISQGKNAADIAAIWNSGSDKGWQDKVGTTTINGQQIKYNVPQYVKSVTDLYQQYKNQTNGATESNQPDNRDTLQKANDVVGSIFPGQEVGQAIGADIAKNQFLNRTDIPQADYSKLSPQSIAKLQAEGVPTTAEAQKQEVANKIPRPTAGQLVGDIAQAGLMVAAPEIGKGAGLLPRLAGQAAIGAGYGATGALAGGANNVGDVVKQAKQGAILGGALGGLGEIVGGLANKIPTSMLQGKFEGLTDAEAQKFLNQNIGSKESLYRQSQKVLAQEGQKVDSELLKYKQRPVMNDMRTEAIQNPFEETIKQFPEFQGNEDKLVQKIKSFVSNSSNIGEDRATIIKYIDNIKMNKANLFEKNQVRKVLDKATKGGYAKLAKAIAPTAGHDIAMTFADILRNEIKTKVPSTIPMFDEMQKSINIRNAIDKVIKKKGSHTVFKYSDVIPFLGGNTLAPGIGGIGGVIANRAIENPATRFAGAKLARGIGKVATGSINASKGLLPGLLKKTNPTQAQR